jgi:GTP-binding protein Era
LLLGDDLPPDHRSGFVALVGAPNVGKSTLLNTYVGEKIVIVSSKPQTTRRRLRGILTLPNAQIIFVDTPGIHQPLHKLGEFMVTVATRAIPDADLALFLVDLACPYPTDEDRQVAELLKQQTKTPVFFVMNKVDRVEPSGLEERVARYRALGTFEREFIISATRGDGRDELLQAIIDRLPVGPRYYPADQTTDQSQRFIASELIREQALHALKKEVPHSLEVVVEEWKERPNDLLYIGANIYLERESHKSIVIGRKGSMLKRIGQAARKELEQFVGRRVYLDLWVKVRPKWRRRAADLRRLGYVLRD